ncbi:MAG TPA: hypothetical protein VIE87_13765 [Pseudolabrys sp.]|jgi:hypothetical protein
MDQTAGLIEKLFRLAFWPLAAAIPVVLLLQPIYFLSLTSLGPIASRDRTILIAKIPLPRLSRQG